MHTTILFMFLYTERILKTVSKKGYEVIDLFDKLS